MRRREVVMSELKEAVKEERLSTLKVLYLLREVERDRHYLEMAYPSLFEFATQELGYSAGAAQRRIQAMRLLKVMPEMESKVEDGSLSLCVAAKTQSFFRQVDQKRKDEGAPKLTLETKRQIAHSMVGASKQQCERRLAEISPESALPKERARPVAPNKTLVQFVADDELMQKLGRLKGMLAHQNFEGKLDRLVEILADMALKKLDPAQAKGRKSKVRTTNPQTTDGATAKATPDLELIKSPDPAQESSNSLPPVEVKPKSKPPKPRRQPTAQEDREVRLRDEDRCTFIDEKTGKRCTSRHALQRDHAIPFAWGGETNTDNLRLRCWAHNRFTAEQMGLV